MAENIWIKFYANSPITIKISSLPPDCDCVGFLKKIIKTEVSPHLDGYCTDEFSLLYKNGKTIDPSCLINDLPENSGLSPIRIIIDGRFSGFFFVVSGNYQ